MITFKADDGTGFESDLGSDIMISHETFIEWVDASPVQRGMVFDAIQKELDECRALYSLKVAA